MPENEIIEQETPVDAESVVEAANVGEWLESRIHVGFTEIADGMFGEGRLTRDERKVVSHAIGLALDAFRSGVEEGAPHLYTRDPFSVPTMSAETPPAREPAVEAVAEAAEPIAEVPAVEADLGDEYTSLVEKSVRKDGTIPIKIIAPGWGSSGFYPADVLERDGPKVFTKGMHAYWNHPSLSEEKDRPERSLRDLAGTLTKDAYWDANGPAGPGLYGEAQVVSAYRDAVTELAPHIGMSIRAYGKVREGEADGRKGKVISELASARSVDFVTAAGAGGKILELFESAGRESPAERIQNVTEEERQAVLAENARLAALVVAFTEAQRRARSLELATEVLSRADLPAVARVRIAAAQALMPVLAEDGTLDEAAYTAQIEAAANAEVAYVKEIRGPSGAIVGMGGSTAPIGAAQLKESFLLMYKRQGKSAEEAERMASVAAQGR